MKMVLEGIRVIDWSAVQAGPAGAAMLADLGAEVIHVEERGVGDPLRGILTSFGIPSSYPDGRHINFEEHNRNKKSLAIDIKKAQGKEIIYRLVEKSDIFITNFRASAAKRLAMDYETLSRHNSKLIYCLSSGLGHLGPDSDLPCLDLVALARGGTCVSFAPPDSPSIGTPGVADRGTSTVLGFAVLAALLARERQGIGQEVHVSQLGTMIWLQGYHIMLTLGTGIDPPSFDRTDVSNPVFNFYRCKDGKWVALCAFRVTEWPEACKAMGLDLLNDPRFSTIEKRTENRKELISILEKEFLTKNSDEWLQRFREYDVRAAPVRKYSELASDPQVVANDYIVDWDRPGLGPVKFVGFPYSLTKTPPTLRTPAPEVGQHTEEIMLDTLGYTWEELEQLKKLEVL